MVGTTRTIGTAAWASSRPPSCTSVRPPRCARIVNKCSPPRTPHIPSGSCTGGPSPRICPPPSGSTRLSKHRHARMPRSGDRHPGRPPASRRFQCRAPLDRDADQPRRVSNFFALGVSMSLTAPDGDSWPQSNLADPEHLQSCRSLSSRRSRSADGRPPVRHLTRKSDALGSTCGVNRRWATSLPSALRDFLRESWSRRSDLNR